MAKPDVKFVLSAEDRSKLAFASVLASLKALRTNGEGLSKMFGLLIPGASFLGMAAFAKSGIDAASALEDLNLRTGVSVETLSDLRLVAEQSDTSLESLGKAINKLSIFMAENGKEAKALGLTAKDPADAFMQLATVLQNTASVQDRASIARKVLGKAYEEALPALSQTTEELRQQIDRGRELAGVSTQQAIEAHKFNDEVSALKVSLQGLSITVTGPFVEAMNALIEKFKEGAKEGGKLQGVWEALKLAGNNAVGNLHLAPGFGPELAQAIDEVTRLQDVVSATRQKLATGKAKIPLIPWDIKFNDAAMATLRKNLAEQEAALTQAKARVAALDKQPAPAAKPVGTLTADMLKPKAAAPAPRLPELRAEFDAELALTKTALDDQSSVIETALQGQLISSADYWKAKRAITVQQLDLESRTLQKAMVDEQDLIDRLAKVKPASANQADELKGRILTAHNKLAELQAQLQAVDGKKITEEFSLTVNADKAKRDIDDAIAQARDELAKASGTETDAQRREMVAVGFRSLLANLAGDAASTDLVNKLIDVKAASANLDDLQAKWQTALNAMSAAEQSANIQQQQGLITTVGAQAQIAAAHRATAAELEKLLPLMEAAANAIGPDAVARVAAWKNELASVKVVVDPVAESINTGLKDALSQAFSDIGSANKSGRQAAQDFLRGVVQVINSAASKQLGESLFNAISAGGSSGGIGGFFSSLFGTAPGGKKDGSSPASALYVQDVSVAAQASSTGVFGAEKVGPGLGDVLGGMLGNIFSGIKAAFVSLISGLGNALSGIFGGGGGQNVFGSIASFFGFAEGGWTGPGAKYQPAGLVHAGEFVFSREAVQRFGINALDNLHRIGRGMSVPNIPRLSYADGGAVNLPAAAAQQNSLHVKVINFNDLDAAMAEYLKTRRGERAVLNVIQRNPGAAGA